MKHNIMRRSAIALFWILSCITVHGQVQQVGSPDASKHPEVSFQVNLRNPEVQPEKYFKIEEGEDKPTFTMTLSDTDKEVPPRHILVIWEYLPSQNRAAQNTYFRTAILRALPGILTDEKDVVNIATFAWTEGANALSYLGVSFSNDTAPLAEMVKLAKSPNGKGVAKDHGSELYPAISEGIKKLSGEEGARVLIVLSNEFPNIFNATSQNAPKVITEARDADVAVYNVRYRAMNEKYSLDDVATATYGLSHEADKADPGNAATAIIDFAEKSATRALGLDYKFTFSTKSERDGVAHQFQLKAGTEATTVSYNAPSLGLGGWLAKNMILSIVILVLILAAAVGGFLLMQKQKKAKAVTAGQERARIQEIENRNRTSEENLAKQQKELEKIKAQEAEKQRTAQHAMAEKEAEALYTEMFANGKTPRFVITVNGKSETVLFPSPVTTVGRAADNDVVVDAQTMSRSHFQVVYQHGVYNVVDLGSTNGTLLNGSAVTHALLRHGDMITASGVTFHFYV